MGNRAAFFTMQWRAVHAKFLLADDRWMTIGSANANDRSFLLDSELNVAVDDTKLTAAFRRRLWARNLGLSEADVTTWTVSDYLDRWRQIAAANKGLLDTAFDPAANRFDIPALKAIPGEGVIPFDWTTLPSDTSLPVPDVLATIDFDPKRDQAQTDGVRADGNGSVPTAAAALDTPEEAVAAHPGTVSGVDVDGLASDLLARLPGDPGFVTQAFDYITSTDRDDVAYAIAHQADDTLLSTLGGTAAGRTLLLRMVAEMQAGATSDAEAVEIERIVRLMSPMHARLSAEPWTTDPAVLAALSAAGATMQPITDGVGDINYDEYTVTIDSSASAAASRSRPMRFAVPRGAARPHDSVSRASTWRRPPRCGLARRVSDHPRPVGNLRDERGQDLQVVGEYGVGLGANLRGRRVERTADPAGDPRNPHADAPSQDVPGPIEWSATFAPIDVDTAPQPVGIGELPSTLGVFDQDVRGLQRRAVRAGDVPVDQHRLPAGTVGNHQNVPGLDIPVGHHVRSTVGECIGNAVTELEQRVDAPCQRVGPVTALLTSLLDPALPLPERDGRELVVPPGGCRDVGQRRFELLDARERRGIPVGDVVLGFERPVLEVGIGPEDTEPVDVGGGRELWMSR